MATLKSIRKRVVSVKNTQKITKAMKMVSAAKLRRAQFRLISARPYALHMMEVVGNIATLAPADAHPLLARREVVKTAEFLVLSSDRGLCGGFNGNLLRKIEKTLHQEKNKYETVQISVIGKKGRDFFVARKIQPDSVQTGLYDKFDFAQAVVLANQIAEGYLAGKFDEFYIAYNQFHSAISQHPVMTRLLPFRTETGHPTGEGHYAPEYLYEPGRSELLNVILPKALASMIYRAFLESIAGEYGARMAAMDSATNNCKEMIHRLTLQMNRLRQAVITKELMDIVNGKEALG